MTIELYSILISAGLFLITGIILASGVFYALVPAVKRHVDSHSYASFLGAIAFLGIASVVGALIYQLVYLTPVCELCWWQRIFLFPIGIVALVALWKRTTEAHITVAIMAVIGLFYASYHYYYHFQGLVLGNKLALPCSSGGLLPACTDSPILTFGFVTIPFMGILVFTSVLIIAFFAHRALRRERHL